MKLKRMCGLLTLLTVFVLAGCSFGPDMPEAPKTQAGDGVGQLEYLALLKAMGSYTIGTDELEKQITRLFENRESFGRSAAPDEKTVITGSRKLPIVEKSNKSRSAESEESSVDVFVFETVNSAGTEGYVLASNDMRIGSILAVVDGGTLEDEPEWFAEIVFDGIASYIDYTVDLYNNISDEEIRQLLGEPVPLFESRSVGSGSTAASGKGLIHYWYDDAPNVVSASWSWTEGYDTCIYVNWHQGKPYNYYVCRSRNSSDFNDYVAGCGPVALAQLMSYWGRPTKCTLNVTIPYENLNIYNYTYRCGNMRRDLTDINTAGAKDIAVLMYEIGYRTNSTYTKKSIDKDGKTIEASTTTPPSGMINGLRAMGYVVPNSFSAYNFSKVKSSIMGRKPVIMYGYSSDTVGHFWVIDGVRKMTYTEYLANVYRGYPAWVWDGWDFVYCNVGWGPNSRANAWYVSGIFYMGKGWQSHASRSNDIPGFFQYNLNILPDVYWP